MCWQLESLDRWRLSTNGSSRGGCVKILGCAVRMGRKITEARGVKELKYIVTKPGQEKSVLLDVCYSETYYRDSSTETRECDICRAWWMQR